MPFPKKHENSVIHAFRTPLAVKLFLQESFSKKMTEFTANDFINKLIQDSDDFKIYIAKKQNDDKQPKLFE